MSLLLNLVVYTLTHNISKLQLSMTSMALIMGMPMLLMLVSKDLPMVGPYCLVVIPRSLCTLEVASLNMEIILRPKASS